MSIHTAVIIGLLVALGLATYEAFTWRVRAEKSNEDNLELAYRLDVVERALANKPRIQFGPQIDAPVVESDFPGLLFAEDQYRKANPKLPNNVRRLDRADGIPRQRGGA